MSLSKSALLPATKPFRRLIIIGSLLLFLLAVFLLLEGSGTSRITVRLQGVNDQAYTPKIGRCSHGERQAWAKQWNITARDHHDLLDDRFTYGSFFIAPRNALQSANHKQTELHSPPFTDPRSFSARSTPSSPNPSRPSTRLSSSGTTSTSRHHRHSYPPTASPYATALRRATASTRSC